MKVTAEFSRLRQTGWAEYALRFLFGGVVTVITGWIAQRFGPVIGGLFLSFPAIFPASVTLVERHEQRRKAQHGLAGKKRGRSAASVVAAGAALGSLGLFTFALWSGLSCCTSLPGKYFCLQQLFGLPYRESHGWSARSSENTGSYQGGR
jgi:hypothetical protein